MKFQLVWHTMNYTIMYQSMIEAIKFSACSLHACMDSAFALCCTVCSVVVCHNSFCQLKLVRNISMDWVFFVDETKLIEGRKKVRKYSDRQRWNNNRYFRIYFNSFFFCSAIFFFSVSLYVLCILYFIYATRFQCCPFFLCYCEHWKNE